MFFEKYTVPKNTDSIYVLPYLIISNCQIHSFQIDILYTYLKSINILEDIHEVSNILDGKIASVDLAMALSALKNEDLQIQRELLYMAFLIVNVDGEIDSDEEFVLKKIEQNILINESEANDILINAQIDAKSKRENNNTLFEKPNFKSSYKGICGFFKKIFNFLCKIFLKGKENTTNKYLSTIERCSIIAKEDYLIISPIFENVINEAIISNKILKNITLQMPQDTNISKEVSTTISEFAQRLSNSVENETVRMQNELMHKKRALSDFTISLIGRTKAGKSTLHSILTGQGKDKIGKGLQRTTRYNRVYQWNLLRIIDTPGIGAAESEGRSDEEIAASILPETDIMCFVIVDEGIQKDVLEFIDKASTYNKPIVILLNHKENITVDVKFKRFLQHPFDWLNNAREANLDGYFNRIKRHAKENNYENLIHIYPVFLLPALLAKEDNYSQYAELLWKSSNINLFILQIEQLISNFGTLMRSQTILDGTIQSLYSTKKIIEQICEPVNRKIEELNKQKSSIIVKLDKERNSIILEIEAYINEKFNLLSTQHALEFSEENYDYKGDLSNKWKEYLKDIKFETELSNEVQKAVNKFSDKAKDMVSNVFEDLYFSFKMTGNINIFNIGQEFNFKSAFSITSGILGVAAAFAFFISGPLGWALTGVSAAIGILSNVFKSKEKRRKEAIDKLYDQLNDKIKEAQSAVVPDTIKKINTTMKQIIDNVDKTLSQLINGLNLTINEKNKLFNLYLSHINYLNNVYGWRIMQHYSKKTDKFSYQELTKSIDKVERVFGKNLSIYTFLPIKAQKGLINEAISEIIDIYPSECGGLNYE